MTGATATGRGARAARGGTRRGGLRRRDARADDDGRLQLPPGTRWAWWRPGTPTTWPRRSRCAGEHGLPVVPRGGGTSIAGQATGTGVVLDLTRHMNRAPGARPRARTARVQPGLVLDDLRAGRRPARPHLRPRPLHPQPLHPGRHDRQQRLRRALGGLGHHRRQRPGAGRAHLSRRAGRPRRPGRGGRCRPGCATACGPWPTTTWRCCAPASRSCRAASPDTPWTGCCPSTAATPPGPSPAARAPSGCSPRRPCGWCPPRRHGRSPSSATRTSRAAADAAPLLLPLRPADRRGDGGRPRREGRPVPAARRGLALRRGRRRRPGRGAGPRAAELCRHGRRTAPTGHRRRQRPRPAARPVADREDAAGTATRMPDGTEAWPGWEDCAVPPARLGAYLRDFRALLAEHGLRGAPYGHFGDGCVHARIDFDLLDRAGRRAASAASPRPPRTWSSRTAARCPANTATGRRAPSCCRGCTAPSWSHSFGQVQGSLGPGRRDEPGNAGPSRPLDRTCGSPCCRRHRAPGRRGIRLPG